MQRSTSKTYECRNCHKVSQKGHSKLNIYCSNSCQREFEFNKRITEWKETGIIGEVPLKRYLRSIKDACWECNTKDWNGKPLVLELEHKDGCASNNSEDNVCLLCPNCHSQTDTFKGKNKGNGRALRRNRYLKKAALAQG